MKPVPRTEYGVTTSSCARGHYQFLWLGKIDPEDKSMDWKKLSGKAAQYAADGAVEKTAEFALTKVGPYRVAGIVAKLLMAGAVAFAIGGWALHYFAGYAGVASAVYFVAAVVFGVGFVINTLRNFIYNKAKGALKVGVDWAADEVKKRYAGDGSQTPPAGKPPVADSSQSNTK